VQTVVVSVAEGGVEVEIRGNATGGHDRHEREVVVVIRIASAVDGNGP
jgi:hypothetical protein